MTGTVAPSLPTLGDPNATEDADVRSSFVTLRDALNAVLDSSNKLDIGQLGGTLTNGKILVGNGSGVPTQVTPSGDATMTNAGVIAIGNTKVTGAMLAASTQAAYRTILSVNGSLPNDAASANYIMYQDGSMVASPASITSGVTGKPIPALLNLVAADWTVASLTPKLQTRLAIGPNATAPAENFALSLYPVTIAGAADTLTFTLGAAVSGSGTTNMVTPGASAFTTAVTSADFTLPSNGVYALGLATSGTLANNSAVAVSGQLMVRNV